MDECREEQFRFPAFGQEAGQLETERDKGDNIVLQRIGGTVRRIGIIGAVGQALVMAEVLGAAFRRTAASFQLPLRMTAHQAQVFERNQRRDAVQVQRVELSKMIVKAK